MSAATVETLLHDDAGRIPTEIEVMRAQVLVLREALTDVRAHLGDPEKAALLILLALRVTGDRDG